MRGPEPDGEVLCLRRPCLQPRPPHAAARWALTLDRSGGDTDAEDSERALTEHALMTAASASDHWRPSRAASRNRPALRAEGWISGRAPGERTWWASAGDADNFDPVVLTYPVQLDW